MLKISLFLSLLWSAVCAAELVVTDATVRLLPPGVPNTSAYLTVKNTSSTDVILVSGTADFAKVVELHNHIMKGEVMRMEKQEQVVVPAGESLTFQPGGLHMMLFGLNTSLKEGQTVKLSLIDKNDVETEFDAKVVMPGQESSHAHHHNHH